jgi:ribosomal protein S7
MIGKKLKEDEIVKKKLKIISNKTNSNKKNRD